MATTAEYRLGEFTYPRGWLMVATSEQLSNVPIEARFFGEDVVLFRGESGRPIMLEAYCPHMGAHLAVGPSGATAKHCKQVVGDTILCPNHGWRFEANGQCSEIPYSSMDIPETLRLKSWQLQEHAGCVFAWHDHEKGAPDFELPEVPQWQDDTWLKSPVVDLGIWDSHSLELAEHGVDKIHLANVHGADRVVFHEVSFSQHRAVTTSTTAMINPETGEEQLSTAYSRYTGPAFLLAEMSAGEVPLILLFCHTPVDDGRVRAWHALMMKTTSNQATEQELALFKNMQAMSELSFVQDLEIFQRKRPSLRPAAIIGDPPFRQYRAWYGQFFESRDKTNAIQQKAAGSFTTEGVHSAPWVKVS